MTSTSDKEILEHFNFAYGSNMSEQQMRRRCPSARKLGVARLPSHRLAFNRKGSYRDGGVASIVADGNSDAEVFGIVWALNDHDLAELDRVEDPAAYERAVVRVIMDSGVELDCQTYIAIPEAEYVTPDPEYLAIMVAAAQAAGLPRDYVTMIARS